ncbi:hypothetical protein D3C80_1645690 [compost metagenome]
MIGGPGSTFPSPGIIGPSSLASQIGETPHALAICAMKAVAFDLPRSKSEIEVWVMPAAEAS